MERTVVEKNDTAKQLARELTRSAASNVEGPALTRSMYSSGASLYLVLPEVVARPQHVDELYAVHEVSHRAAGCCGLAGNFGVDKGHYETSVAVAEPYLMPAVRAPATACETQRQQSREHHSRASRRHVLQNPAR